MTIKFEQLQSSNQGHSFMLRGVFDNTSPSNDNLGNFQMRTVSYSSTNPQDPQGDGAPSDFTHTAWVLAGHPVNTTAPQNTASATLQAYTIAKPGNQYARSESGHFTYGTNRYGSIAAGSIANIFQTPYTNFTMVHVGSTGPGTQNRDGMKATSSTDVYHIGGYPPATSAIWKMPRASKNPVSAPNSANTFLPTIITNPAGFTHGPAVAGGTAWSENSNDRYYTFQADGNPISPSHGVQGGSFASGNGSWLISDIQMKTAPGPYITAHVYNTNSPAGRYTYAMHTGTSESFSVHWIRGTLQNSHPLVISPTNSSTDLGFKLPYAAMQTGAGGTTAVYFLTPADLVRGRNFAPVTSTTNAAHFGSPAAANQEDIGVASTSDALYIHGGHFSSTFSYAQNVGRVPFANMVTAVTPLGSVGWAARNYDQGNSESKHVFQGGGPQSYPEINNNHWYTFSLNNQTVSVTTAGVTIPAGPGEGLTHAEELGTQGGFAYMAD